MEPRKVVDVQVSPVAGTDEHGGRFVCRRWESPFPLSRFTIEASVGAACLECPRHGRNFACPPHSPAFESYVADCRTATVIALHMPLAVGSPKEAARRHREGFRRLRRVLVDELLVHRRHGHVVLGSGACERCEPCALEQGKGQCAIPEERIFSLEATGVNVARLMGDAFGVELQWSDEARQAEGVWSVGAVFRR